MFWSQKMIASDQRVMVEDPDGIFPDVRDTDVLALKHPAALALVVVCAPMFGVMLALKLIFHVGAIIVNGLRSLRSDQEPASSPNLTPEFRDGVA